MKDEPVISGRTPLAARYAIYLDTIVQLKRA